MLPGGDTKPRQRILCIQHATCPLSYVAAKSLMLFLRFYHVDSICASIYDAHKPQVGNLRLKGVSNWHAKQRNLRLISGRKRATCWPLCQRSQGKSAV